MMLQYSSRDRWMVATFLKRFFQMAFVAAVLTSLWAYLNGWRATISTVEQLSGHSPLLCLLQRCTDWDCPGCGMTRSLIGFFSGSLSLSFYFHPLGPIVGILICYLFIASFKSQFRLELKHALPQKWSWSFLIIVAAWGILRNVF